jgi:hypothetical protein
MSVTTYDEKTAPIGDEHHTNGSKKAAFHEETAHEAAERGHFATDQ